MRALVLVLAGLAGMKIWTHDHIYRSATEDALVHAYRERAIEACQKDRGKSAKVSAAVAMPFANPAAISLVIGKRDVDVAIWDVENALWPVRYKYPLLVLKGGGPGPDLVCEYDMTLGTATVARLRG